MVSKAVRRRASVRGISKLFRVESCALASHGWAGLRSDISSEFGGRRGGMTRPLRASPVRVALRTISHLAARGGYDKSEDDLNYCFFWRRGWDDSARSGLARWVAL